MRNFFSQGRICATLAGAALLSGVALFSGDAFANNVIVLDSGEATLTLIDEPPTRSSAPSRPARNRTT